ncbi:MAG: hypothetical protein AAGC79_04760 [Pseudomonadota bacterium]
MELMKLREARLWSLANGLTAFSVAQTYAFLFAMGNEEFAQQVASAGSLALVLTVLFCAGLVFLVWHLGDNGIEAVELFEENEDQREPLIKLWRQSGSIRIAILILTHGFAAWVLSEIQ